MSADASRLLREKAALAADILVLRTAAERDAAILAAFQAGSVKQTDAILALRTALRSLYDATGDVLDDYDTDESGASFWRTVEAMVAARESAGVVLGGGNDG